MPFLLKLCSRREEIRGKTNTSNYVSRCHLSFQLEAVNNRVIGKLDIKKVDQ